MSDRTRKKLPSYRLHKSTGQAIVTLNGRTFYLGHHGSTASRRRYGERTAEWLANGRALPAEDVRGDLRVDELVLRYWRFTASYARSFTSSGTIFCWPMATFLPMAPHSMLRRGIRTKLQWSSDLTAATPEMHPWRYPSANAGSPAWRTIRSIC